MNGFRFHTDVSVRFAETDAQGVAHNSAYLVWFEVARVAYLAEFAGGYSALRAKGIAIARDSEAIADGWTSHACVDARTLRPTRIPADLAAAIEAAETTAPSASS
ncbi:MAG: hypothetical protein E6G64_13780 [Actinobacteria bacterium]|nr:MAG: hypothetical protein E6G64_13780 [Actinomycetota bacterium]